MSGVRAAHSLSMEPPPPPKPATADGGVQAMQDILYDILANGMDPESSDVPTQEVERFLFEHARAPKSREQFQAFFAAHGLSVRTRIAPEPQLALPPIQRPASNDAGMPASVPVELAFTGSVGRKGFVLDDAEDKEARPTRRGLAVVGAWLALGCVIALLGAAGYYGYTTILQLQGEIERTTRDGRDTQEALEALRDHAAGLESSVAATGELVQRMDQKSDLLIESLLDDGKNKSRKRR